MTDVPHMTHADLNAVREEVAARLGRHDAEHRERVLILQATADRLDKRVSAVASSEKARLDTLRLECLKLVGQRVSDPTVAARELFDFVTTAPKERQVWIVKRAGAEEDKSYLQSELSWRSWSMMSFATVFHSEADALAEIERIGDRIEGGVVDAAPLDVTAQHWFW